MAICSCCCSSFGGIYDTAKKLGLEEQLDVQLSRKVLTASGPCLYGTHTSNLLDLGMETIVQGRDPLEGMNFYIKYNNLLENIHTFLQYLKKIKTRNFVVCTKYNLGQNTYRLFHFLAQFVFPTSKTELDYCHHWVNARVASRVAERLKERLKDLRKLGNCKKIPEMLGFDGEYPAAHPRDKFSRFSVKCSKTSAVKQSIEKLIFLISWISMQIFVQDCRRQKKTTSKTQNLPLKK